MIEIEMDLTFAESALASMEVNLSWRSFICVPSQIHGHMYPHTYMGICLYIIPHVLTDTWAYVPSHIHGHMSVHYSTC
eukprot:c24951_g1_i2 orf=61-294(+)